MKRPVSWRAAPLFGAVLGALAGAAQAADAPLWEAGVGAAAVRLPLYRGAADSQSWLLPVPYFVYRGRILKADRDGARAVLLDVQRLDVDVSLGFTAPAKSRYGEARAGMPDLDATAELGPRLNLNLVRGDSHRVDLRLPLRASFTLGSDARFIGWSAAPVLNLDLRHAGFNIGLQAGPLWGTRRLHQHFYDVAPEYATATRAAYRAPGGFAGWQATAALSRRSGPLWWGAYLRADTVSGAAFEASPLVTQRNTWSAGFAMAWVFAQSERLVKAED